MQHQAEVYLQDFEGLNSFANVDLKKTQPCLGLIEYNQRTFFKGIMSPID
jgi:hypothetical protein